MTGFSALRLVAVAEATSFLALLVATVIRHSGGGADGVHLLGPLHGVLFLAFVALVLSQRALQEWSGPETFWLLAASVIPFGGYGAEWWLARSRR
jgi:integral membrane protein